MIMMCINDVFQITDELKSVESENQKKEDEVQMKKKLIDLLPDADANIRKLEVSINLDHSLSLSWNGSAFTLTFIQLLP